MPTYWIVVPAEQMQRATALLRGLRPRVLLGVLDSDIKLARPQVTDECLFEDLGVFCYTTPVTPVQTALFEHPSAVLGDDGIANNSVQTSLAWPNGTRNGYKFDHTGQKVPYKDQGVDKVYGDVVAGQLGITSRADREKYKFKIEAICMWDGWYNQAAYGRVYKTMKMIGAI